MSGQESQGQSQPMVENAQENASEEQNLESGAESAQENQAELSAQEPQIAKAIEQKRLKKLKIKYNGKEMEEELPFEIPDDENAIKYMQKQLQLSKMAQVKAQEAATLQQEVAEFIQMLRSNPKKALSDPAIGLDIKELARQVIEEEIENAQKSPEQLEREKLQAELQAIKDEREKERTEAQRREQERLQEQEYERYDMLMTKAIEKSDLPKSPYVVKKMADYMLLALDNNIELTPDDVLPLVRTEIENDIKDMFSVMPEEVIESLIGKDKMSKLRKRNLAKAKTAPTPLKSQIKDVAAQKSQPKPVDTDKVSMKKFFGF